MKLIRHLILAFACASLEPFTQEATATRGDPDLSFHPSVNNRISSLALAEASRESYRQLASPLGLSEGAVKVAVHRLRHRFREVVRAEIAQTVATPAEVDEELRCLMAALNG